MDLLPEIRSLLEIIANNSTPQSSSWVKSVLPYIGGIAGAIVAGFGVFIAWRGLTTWKQQIHGENQYSLALDVLVGSRLVLDRVHHYRNPFMQSEEFLESYAHYNDGDLPEVIPEGDEFTDYVYRRRTEAIIDEYEKVKDKVEKLKVVLNDYKFDNWDGKELTYFMREVTNARRIDRVFSKTEKGRSSKEYEKAQLLLAGSKGDDFYASVEQYFSKLNLRLRKCIDT